MTRDPKKLRIILFGATGMIGSGVLQSCLADPQVESVLVIGRTPCRVSHEKVTEILHPGFFDYSSIQSRLSGYTSCLFALGVSAAGLRNLSTIMRQRSIAIREQTPPGEQERYRGKGSFRRLAWAY